MKKTVRKLSSFFVRAINKISLKIHKIKNRNLKMTIIARDCIGGVLYNQYGLKFLSPTINLFFTQEDFNLFCLHLKDYIDGALTEDGNNYQTYPVGLLHSASGHFKVLTVNFMHYKTFEDAYIKWEERKKRIQWDKIYVVSTFCYPLETDTLSNQLVENFNSIPYKKVILVDKKYGFDNEYVINKPNDCKDHTWLLCVPGKIITWKKIFNNFNFDSFFKR